MAVDLTVRTLRGSIELRGLTDSLSVAAVKEMLHLQHKEGPFAVPDPDRQRLVYKGRVLRDGAATLSDAGLSSGDVLVLLVTPTLPPPPEPVSTPTPDAAALRAAVMEEARLRGLDPSALGERAPGSRVRRGGGGGGLVLNLPAELLGGMDPRMVQLLQQALNGGAALEDLGAQLAAGGGAAGGLPGDPAAGPGDYEVEDVVPPEPPAGAMAQLAEMGFGEALARKALLLTRHSVDLALEWLLTHAEEPGAADPPTAEQLRAVWGTRRRRRRAAAATAAAGTAAAPQAAPAPASAAAGAGPSTGAGGAPAEAGAAGPAAQPPAFPPAAAPGRPAPPPAAVSEAAVGQLVEMGFSSDAAQRALLRFGGSVDLAVAYLLTAPPAESAVGPPAAAAGGASSSAATAAAPQPQPQEQPLGGAVGRAPVAPPFAATGGGSSMELPQPSGEGDAAMAEAGSPGAAGTQAATSSPTAGRGPGQQQGQGDAPQQDEADMMDAEQDVRSDEYEEGVEWLEEGGEEEDEGDDDDEEFLDPDSGEAAAMQQLGNALGNLGSMDLAQLGSADMEQLLQGIDVEELVGSQLFPGPVEPGTLGTNAHDVLLRIMEAPGLLQQVLGGGGGGGSGGNGGGGARGGDGGGVGAAAAEGQARVAQQQGQHGEQQEHQQQEQ